MPSPYERCARCPSPRRDSVALVYDSLLLLHVIAAFAVVATVVIFTAFALGWTADARLLRVGNALWAVGGLGTLALGIWPAIYVDGYEIWDGWIIGAIVVWAVATELGRRAQVGYTEAVTHTDAAPPPPSARPGGCTGCARWPCSPCS